MRHKVCPECWKELYYDFDLKRWKHSLIQRQKEVGRNICNFILMDEVQV